MKHLLKLLLLVVLTVSGAFAASAKEYGVTRSSSPYRFVVSDGPKLNVRQSPSSNGTLITQLKPGDVIYFDQADTVYNQGYSWVQITDEWNGNSYITGYVTNLQRFEGESNPYYYDSEEDQIYDDGVNLEARERTQDITKIILLILTILLAGAGIFIYFVSNGTKSILGSMRNGMRRTFFFNTNPYLTVVYISLIILAAGVASLLVLLLVGGVGFVVMWIIKILCYVLLWIGIISCVVGVIACICGACVGAIPAILGGLIWYKEDAIKGFGESCADAGLEFFRELNVIDFSWELVKTYWAEALMIAAIPIAIFLGLAILWMLIAGAFMLVERIMTSRYNIKHPCPHCQQPSEPATYLSLCDDGYRPLPNDIKLRPGMYGLFHITHPKSGERMPTMLLNGRDNLARRCAHCGKLIQANEGTEIHLAMVGSPKAGKSTLTYRMIAEIFRRAGNDRVSFTDEKQTIKDRYMTEKIANIVRENRISEENMPAKTALDDLASTQLIVKRKNMPVPYRLFINDIGGEFFDIDNRSANQNLATRYMRNVDTVVLLLDPFTTDFSDYNVSKTFKTWMEKNVGEYDKKLVLDHLRNSIANHITDHGKKLTQVHLNIVLPKVDSGYIPSDYDLSKEEDLRRFLEQELDLGNLLHWAQQFASVNIIAVSAVSSGDKSGISRVIDEVVVKQLGISI